jgi:hypothetical protein
MVSAVVAQKLGVQGLQKNKRFQARGEALLPKAAPLSSAPAVRAGKHEGEPCERFAGANVHLLRLPRLVSAFSPARDLRL